MTSFGMFEGFAAQEDSTGLTGRSGAVIFSCLLHGLLVIGALYLSMRPHDSSDNAVPVLFYTPPPPPPPVAKAPKVVRKKVFEKPKEAMIVQPESEDLKPVEEEPVPEEELEPEDAEVEAVEGGVEGGVDGGVAGGVVGGTVGNELPPEGAPVSLKRGMTPPRLIPSSKVKPVYPRSLREAGISGRLLLMIVVKRNGTVGRVEVKSGDKRLAPAAIDAVKQWRYHPAVFKGKTLAVWMPVMMRFQFEE